MIGNILWWQYRLMRDNKNKFCVLLDRSCWLLGLDKIIRVYIMTVWMDKRYASW